MQETLVVVHAILLKIPSTMSSQPGSPESSPLEYMDDVEDIDVEDIDVLDPQTKALWCLATVDLATLRNPSAHISSITRSALAPPNKETSRGRPLRREHQITSDSPGKVDPVDPATSPAVPKPKRARRNPPVVPPTTRVTRAKAPRIHARASSEPPSPKTSDLLTIDGMLGTGMPSASALAASFFPPVDPTSVLKTSLFPHSTIAIQSTAASSVPLLDSAKVPLKDPIPPLPPAPSSSVPSVTFPPSIFQHSLDTLFG